MADGADQVHQLELEITHLMDEVARYRSAAEDALQQLDWCIDYFTGTKNRRVAQALSANRAEIRRKYLKRAGQAAPATEGT